MKYIYLYHGWKWLPDSQKRDVLQTYLDEVMYEDGKTSYAVEIQDSSRMGEKEARADRNKNVITLSSSLLYENLSYHCNENTNSDVANVLLCVTGFPTGSEQYTLKERPAGDYFRKSVMETKALLVLISDYCDRKDRGTTNIEIKGVSRNAINVDQTELIITEANIAHQKKYIAEQFDKIKRNSSTLDQKVYEDVKDVINDLNDFKSRLIQNLYIRQRVTKTFEEDVEVDHANNKCIERANTELNRLYDEYLNLGDKNGFLDNCCNVFLTGLGIIGKNTAAYVSGSQGQVRTTLSEKMQEINESKENNNVNMGPRKGIIREQQMRAQ
jgi:hypothetical protein